MTWKKVIAWSVGSILGVVVLVLALLHVPSVLRPVLLGALRMTLTDKMEMSISASRVAGSPFSGLSVSELRLATAGDSTWMNVKRLDVDYAFWPLLRGRVNVARFEMEGTSFALARRTDGRFILPVWERNPDNELPSVRVDIIRLSDMAGSISEFAGDTTAAASRSAVAGGPEAVGAAADTLWVLRSAGLEVTDLALGPAAADGLFSVRVDTLHAAFDYASTDGAAPDSAAAQGGRLAARGAWAGLDPVPVSTLALSFEAPHSRLALSAEGAPRAASPTGLEALEASASGYVGLDDLAPFIAGVRSGTQVQVDLAARADSLEAHIDALFTTSAGGSVTLKLQAVPEMNTQRTAFSARADVSNLSPSEILTTFPEGETRLGLSASADGWFHRADTLAYAADVSIDLEDGILAGWALGAGRADITAGHDATSWTARVSSRGAALSSRGRLGRDGALRADMDVSGITHSTFGSPGSPPDSTALPFRMNFGVTARGRLDSLALGVRLSDSSVGDCPLSLTRGRGRFQAGRSRMALDVRACDAPLLAAVLSEGGNDAATDWSVTADLFPAPLHRMLLLDDSTSASGTLSARLKQSRPVASSDAAAITAHLRLSDIVAGGARIDSVDARATGTTGRVGFSATLFQTSQDSLQRAQKTSHPALRVGGRWTAASPRNAASVHLDDVAADSLDLGRIVDLAPHTAQFQARGSGTLFPHARLQLDLTGSILNGVHLEHADLDYSATTDSTRALVSAGWKAPPRDGQARDDAALEARIVQLSSGNTDGHISFSHMDIRQMLPDSSHTSDLSGRMSVQRDGAGRWTGELEMDSTSTLNGVVLGGASGQLHMDTERMAGRLDVGRTTGTDSTAVPEFTASASFGYASGQLYADASLFSVPFARLAGIDAESGLDGRLETNLYLENGDWTQIAVSTHSLKGFFGELVIDDGAAEFVLTPSSLRLDSLHLAGPGLRIDGRGFLEPGASDLRVDMEWPSALLRIPQLKTLGVQMAGAQANIRVTGSQSGRRAVGDLEFRGLRNDQVFFNRLDGRLLAEWGSGPALVPSVAELTLTSDVIQVLTAQLSGAQSRISWDGEALQAETDITITPTRTIAFSAALQPDDDPPVLFLDSANIRLDETHWDLASPARLTLGDNPMLSGFVMASGDRRLSAISTRRPGELARHVLVLDRIPLGAGADLFGYAGLDGELSGQVSLAESSLQGTLHGTVSAYGQEIGPFSILVGMENGLVTLRSELSHASGGRLQAEGTLPLGDSGAQAVAAGDAAQTDIRFTVEARNYPIGWTRVFVDPLLIDDLRGTLSGTVDISGQTSSPVWQGAMTLSSGRIGLPNLGKRRGLRYSNVEADLAFRADSLIVERARATSGDGDVTGRGHMILTNLQLGTLAVDFEANRFLAVDNNDYRTVISGQGRLEGTTERPRFGGDLRVVSADFFLTDNTTSDAFEPVTLTGDDLLTLQERFGVRIAADDTTAFDFYRVLAIDGLTIRLQRDSWFRSKSNPEMDIQLEGRLDVSKNRNQDPSVFGTISVNPARSQIRQFGRRFRLDKGTFTFNGPMDAPIMDMEASYEVPSRSSGGQEVTIRLLVSGTPEELTVDFESDPAMELADIVSYIATGRPASESFQIVGSQNDNYLQSAAGLAMGPVTDLMENLAASNLGLDVIEITQSGTQGMTLTAGKYVSPKLYVSISQPFSLSEGAERSPSSAEQDTQVAMEYEIVRNLLISLLSRGTILRVNLRWEYAF